MVAWESTGKIVAVLRAAMALKATAFLATGMGANFGSID
jgi:hypothetical protein